MDDDDSSREEESIIMYEYPYAEAEELWEDIAMEDYYAYRYRIDDGMDDSRVVLWGEPLDLVNENHPSITKITLQSEDQSSATVDLMRSLLRGLHQNAHVQKLDLYLTPYNLRRNVCQNLLPPLLRENSTIRYIRFPHGTDNTEFLPNAEILCNNGNTTLETVDMIDCTISGREGGEIIGRLMRNNGHITTIVLRGNRRLGCAGVKRVAAALGHDDCRTLKVLDLRSCGHVFDGSANKLFLALEKNDSLEKILVDWTSITGDSYRVLARSLPRMRGLKAIDLGWALPVVSAEILQQMIDGLRMNRNLQVIDCFLDDCVERQRNWRTCCEYVGARNKMNCHLDELRDRAARVAASEGQRCLPVPFPIDHLLLWCGRRGNAEVQASLIHPLLRSRATEIFAGLVDVPRARKRVAY